MIKKTVRCVKCGVECIAKASSYNELMKIKWYCEKCYDQYVLKKSPFLSTLDRLKKFRIKEPEPITISSVDNKLIFKE